MNLNYREQLPHLTEEIVYDARGSELDAYSIALEGWRRGLTLKWYAKDSEEFPDMKTWFTDKPGKLYSLSSESKTHYFFKTRGDKVTNEAVEICLDKDQTKQWLSTAGLQIPEGKRFTADNTVDEIIKFVSGSEFPVVLKPTDGSFGRGVLTNIQNLGEFKKALNYIRTKLNYTDVMVERHIDGDEYRLYVVENKVVGAIKRIPANVVGDGKNSIKRLIELKNKKRESNPRLVSCLIKPDQEMVDFILTSGYTFESIPSKGEVVYLTGKSNISTGGDPIDSLDSLPDSIKETAVKALKAVPGLAHAAIDLIIDGTGRGVILEINPTAQIGSLLFPLQGKARDIPAAIIDYYFPETKGIKTDKEKIYFNFNDLLEPLSAKKASTTTVAAAPVGNIYSKVYRVGGRVQNSGYHRGLRKQAFDRKLSGFVKSINNNLIEVVVSGTDKESVDDFKHAILTDPERSTVRSIEEVDWKGPVKVGFEVKAGIKLQAEQYKSLIEQKEKLIKEIKQAEVKNRKYKESTSWKLTKPIRGIAGAIKRIKGTNKKK